MVLLLARALFRADKWDPLRDANEPFVWEDRHQVYRPRARRLLAILEKDGLALEVAPTKDAPASDVSASA